MQQARRVATLFSLAACVDIAAGDTLAATVAWSETRCWRQSSWCRWAIGRPASAARLTAAMPAILERAQALDDDAIGVATVVAGVRHALHESHTRGCFAPRGPLGTHSVTLGLRVLTQGDYRCTYRRPRRATLAVSSMMPSSCTALVPHLPADRADRSVASATTVLYILSRFPR